ncbi:MAG: twin-arginine translocase TatA/TatE family subunit [Bacteroides sp.]|nr:twin-arginine translocase TatA/TatE family subunit [Bacteroides sp.]
MNSMFLLALPSGSEILIIALIIILLFGGKKIPELMKGLGKGVKSFKDGVSEAKDEINKAKDDLNDTTTKQ